MEQHVATLKPGLSKTLLGGVIVFLILAQALLLGQLRSHDYAFVEPPASQKEKWSPDLVRILSFGQLATAVDMLWLRTLSDPAQAHVLPGEHARSFYDLDLATDLDPAFFELYNLGSYVLTIVRNDNEGAKTLLEKGRRFYREDLSGYPAGFQTTYWSRSWNLYLTLAYVDLFELQDMPSAAKAFGEAAKIPGSPAYLQSLSERLQQPGGEYAVALRLINHLIETAPDEVARTSLLTKRKSLYLAQYLHGLNERFRSFSAKDRQFRAQVNPERSLMERIWREFQKSEQVPPQDPWGGQVLLSPSGRITSATPHEKVFGLE